MDDIFNQKMKHYKSLLYEMSIRKVIVMIIRLLVIAWCYVYVIIMWDVL